MTRTLPIILGLLLAACGETPPESKAPAAAKPALSVTAVQPQTLTGRRRSPPAATLPPGRRPSSGRRSPTIALSKSAPASAMSSRAGSRWHASRPRRWRRIRRNTRRRRRGRGGLAEARASLERARQLRDKGFYSAQQLTQAQAAAETAQARLAAAQARRQSAGLRKSKTEILAPDAGIISARGATVGATVQPGQELFRLIRGGRLEWRAEVAAADLSRLRPGVPASVTTPAGERLEGKVRVLAPTVDTRTHTALVYVDLPADAAQADQRRHVRAR
jgi:multidrug efflux pump subunit AcrA (membrane-fusion protein)